MQALVIKIDCNVKKTGLNLIHLKLLKLVEFCFIVKSTNAVVVSICESLLDVLLLEQEISIDNYKFCFVIKTDKVEE